MLTVSGLRACGIEESTLTPLHGNPLRMYATQSRRRLVLPLGLQLFGLLVGALVVAQLVTLALTVLIPPTPVQRWDMEDVAQSLLGASQSGTLERTRMAGPPDIGSPGWLVSESSREVLAERLGRPVEDVVLAFYTQLPVGGVTVPVNGPRSPIALSGPQSTGISLAGTLLGTAHAQTPPGGLPPGGLPAGGLPAGGLPGGGLPGGGLPGGGVPGGGLPGGGVPGGGASGGGLPGGGMPGSAGGPRAGNPGGKIPGGGLPGGSLPGKGAPGSPVQAPQPRATGPIGNGKAPVVEGMPGAAAARPGAPSMVTNRDNFPQPSLSALPARLPRPSEQSAASKAASPPSAVSTPRLIVPVPVSIASESAEDAAASDASAVSPRRESGLSAVPRVNGVSQPIPFRQQQGLLSFTTPPFIEGDFIASMREPDGGWIAVAPRAEPFPNRWQQRVMLWFVLSLLVVAPVAWLFARRIVNPLENFAHAAEMLGRDPSATVLPLSGPAEIGRAAHAFNQMKSRLRAFVDDRTAMVGAISHDLRTPLTRLRFRLEDVPDDQRDALLREVEDMELMISQVIAFIRDASTPGPRERVDLAELVESSVEDARVTGARIELETSGSVPVEVDPMGMRRLLGNLLENAIKYGGHARVRVHLHGDNAVAEVIDDGPGMPPDECDRAFEPFFRGERALESEKPGNGLGLAVCRSIARAHGGEVQLEQRAEGFVASVSVPLSYGDGLRKVA